MSNRANPATGPSSAAVSHHRPPSASSSPAMPSSPHPPSPTSTSTALESDFDLSDVSSLHPSEENDAADRDLSSSAWTDLGSSRDGETDQSGGGGNHSRRQSSSSYTYSSGRSRDGDEDTSSSDRGGRGERGARSEEGTNEDDYNENEDNFGLEESYVDLEPSIHSDPTLTDTSAGRSISAATTGHHSTLSTTASQSLSSSTSTTTLESSPQPNAFAFARSAVNEFNYPDPSTVASSFSSSQGSQHSFRRSNSTPLASGPSVPVVVGGIRMGSSLSYRPGGERPGSAFARGNGRRMRSEGVVAPLLSPASSDVLPSPSAIARPSSTPMIASSYTAPLLSEKPLRSASSTNKPLASLPPRIHVLLLGTSPPQHSYNPLVKTALSLLHASLAEGQEAVPALLKEYDLLGGTKSSRMVGDLREPFRKERKVSLRAKGAPKEKAEAKEVCKIEVGDLTVEETDEPGTLEVIKTHLVGLSNSRPTSFLVLHFQPAQSPVAGSSSLSRLSTKPVVDFIEAYFYDKHHSVKFLPVVLPSRGGFGDYSPQSDAMTISEVLELRGKDGAQRLFGTVLEDGFMESKQETVVEPIVEVKINAKRLKKEVPRYLLAMFTLPVLFGSILLALGSLPDRFDPLAATSISDARTPYPRIIFPQSDVSSLPVVSSSLGIDDRVLANIRQAVATSRSPPKIVEVPTSPNSVAGMLSTPPAHPLPISKSTLGTRALSIRTVGDVAVSEAQPQPISLPIEKKARKLAEEVIAPSSPSAPLRAVSAMRNLGISSERLVEISTEVLSELDASKPSWFRSLQAPSTIDPFDNTTSTSPSSKLNNGQSSLFPQLKPTFESIESLATYFTVDVLNFVRATTTSLLDLLPNSFSSIFRNLEPLVQRVQRILSCLRQGSSSVADAAQSTVHRAQRGLRIEEEARRRALQSLFGDASRIAEEGFARSRKAVEDGSEEMGVVVEAASRGVAKATSGGRLLADETLKKSTRGLHRAQRDAKGLMRDVKAAIGGRTGGSTRTPSSKKMDVKGPVQTRRKECVSGKQEFRFGRGLRSCE